MAMLSSPLAAMQPAPRQPMFGSFGMDAEPAPPRQSGSLGRSTKFSFPDLIMPAKIDSTDGSSHRASSPTISLLADLSQNFYIEKSPRVPTPRRSLFTSAVFSRPGEGATTQPKPWEGVRVTTPPIPSSPPPRSSSSMDMSPLPHKVRVPFSLAKTLAGSPGKTTVEDDMLPTATVVTPKVERRPFAQRRRSSLLRPSLSKTKQSVAILGKPLGNQLPPFTFGAGGNGKAAPDLSLEDCFADSPPQERNIFASAVGAFARPRPRPATRIVSCGSPMQGLAKRPAEPSGRPRKQFRRTLSMFEHPADVMKTETKRDALESIMDVDEGGLKLPHVVPDDQPGGLPRISQETMVSVLGGEFNHLYDDVMVIDCRFEYEYNGGHINGAANFNDKEQLAQKLFAQTPGPLFAQPEVAKGTLIVLHCEYSVHRAPLMAKYIREADRTYNIEVYPKLTYPELYILEGGYSAFFKTHPTRCFPQSYVEMGAKEHERACERGLSKIRQRSKIGRAATFAAFGRPAAPIAESPPAAERRRNEGRNVTW